MVGARKVRGAMKEAVRGQKHELYSEVLKDMDGRMEEDRTVKE